MALATQNNLIKSKLTSALLATVVGTLVLTGCSKEESTNTQSSSDVSSEAAATESRKSSEQVGDQATVEKLLTSYANMAQAGYEDSLSEAKKLQAAIDTFVADPTQANLDAAKVAYKAARQPYSQTEVFRFDEGFVSANEARKIGSVDGWEGQVNAWPLDEALIDYVSEGYAGEYNSKDNIINSDSITVGSIQQDTKTITPELLAEMNEIGGSEANVTTGYHAIEFLLWGQDTNGVGEGAGNRPFTDYKTDASCTSGEGNASDAAICAKRGDYLKAAAQLLVNDLTDMVGQWQPGSENTLRSDLMARSGDNAVRQLFYQMGSLALGELASERMQVAFVTGSTEDEHECFSDLTHLSYANNARGISNVFHGQYKTVSGQTVGDYGIKQFLIDDGQQEAAKMLEAEFDKVTASFNTIEQKGENEGIKVDQMIATAGQVEQQGISAEQQNERRSWIESAINDLKSLTDAIEHSAKSMGIDNLDADGGSKF
ncbi:imelysin family protein [Psychrobacter sp. FDAARGOS_221]|uniref:imelysin family protein n=1 Tax=Psychrobacter sp. FDAARGOS_221 TaxID=1975705 RepID=UPI000BB58546|nr:imelysin family protein [Psychrobacter sp. FDAARGOS_221]PNK61006.1 imelysin [Psychrobacter sp. FDAARGOS_221]